MPIRCVLRTATALISTLLATSLSACSPPVSVHGPGRQRLTGGVA